MGKPLVTLSLVVSLSHGYNAVYFEHSPPKQKSHHFDEIFITDCTKSCQNDNFQCRQ